MGHEEWKSIKGYEGLYQISNHGEIYSLRQHKMLKQSLNNKGYFRVALYDEGGNEKWWFAHRLVAEAFIPHTEDKDTVNHLDFNPQNNSVDNLEWTDRNGNMRYSAEAGRFNKTEEWKKQQTARARKDQGKSVLGRNIASGEYIVFECLNDTAKHGFTTSSVSQVCNGIRNSHKGYTFRFISEQEKENWNI